MHVLVLIAVLFLGLMIGASWANFSWQLTEARELSDKAVEARGKVESNQRSEKLHRQESIKHKVNAMGWIFLAIVCLGLTTVIVAGFLF